MKFSSSGDLYNVVKAEYVAMRLANLAGFDVASIMLTRAGGRDVLLVERFDRVAAGQGWTRRAIVSALSLLNLDAMMARCASYEDLSHIVRARFIHAKTSLRELFVRLVFDILVGNNDDHVRNHAAFWDGRRYSLTPAYDICPQNRTRRETGQAMLIVGQDRSSRLSTCVVAAANFLLDREEARLLIAAQIDCAREHWSGVCEEASLSEAGQRAPWGRQFLNPYAFEGFDQVC